MNNKKMIRIARVLDKIAVVANVMIRIMLITCVVCGVMVLVFGDKMVAASDTLTLDLDYVRLHLAQNVTPDPDALKLFLTTSMVMGVVLSLAAGYIVKLLRGILAPMKEGRPFEASVSTNLRRMAAAVAIGGFAAEAFSVAGRIMVLKAEPLEQIFSGEAVTKIEYFFAMNCDFLMVSVVLLFLSYVFAYGQMLQQEADETL